MISEPLATLSIADSTFACHISTARSLSAIALLHSELKSRHAQAAHVPYAASVENYGNASEDKTCDDGEPEAAMVGRELLRVLNSYKRGLRRQKTMKVRGSAKERERLSQEDSDNNHFDSKESDRDENGPSIATAVFVVRYFHGRLLGVTCGRLTSLYGRVARLALHRHLHGNLPYVEKYSFGSNHWRNVYGLGAGDTELILDVVPLLEYEDGENSNESNSSFVKRLLSELQFEGMVGSDAEMLPRLQNLQADLPVVDGSTIIPIYRYPGNYSGTEWKTHPWSPTTLYIKRCVEMALRPLYYQHMNHSVTNYYRDGEDKIDHHSDKDLDLNRDGVIVSVSLGCMRVMELRDRGFPHDITRVELPPGSMFVLGPFTNAKFTHSVLPKLDANDEKYERKFVSYREGDIEGNNKHVKSIIDSGGRISVTFRDARSFLDVKTQRLFGQGLLSSFETPILVKDGIVTNDSLSMAVKRVREEDVRERKSAMFVAVVIGFGVGCVSSHDWVSRRSSQQRNTKSIDMMVLLSSAVSMAISTSASYWYLRFLKNEARRKREEKDAREFFSKKSASGNKY
ncbi:hypothetical protein HJC23_001162 [Cyclotella cryptica]|uniref:Fe2OG dioxygenase domain-containing protein n=1 Tax=Cyclotella cryptica TaxID=29204 RepID=A0ABD3QP74_9STRA|eukprot:CCRYP_003786-RA/>CCRYP_003786-RA protein AED:0.03 eAED:0.03 QI:220/1/1/1/1/1/2/1856/569